MDDGIRRFRRQVARELGDRQGAERRYSSALRQEAVQYWRAREAEGDGLGDVALALGVAPVTLRRWAQDARFRAVVHVVPDPVGEPGVVVTVSAAGIRIEGLDVEAAAQLVARLR